MITFGWRLQIFMRHYRARGRGLVVLSVRQRSGLVVRHHLAQRPRHQDQDLSTLHSRASAVAIGLIIIRVIPLVHRQMMNVDPDPPYFLASLRVSRMCRFGELELTEQFN